MRHVNEELYRAVTSTIGADLIQVAATLYELLYRSAPSQRHESGHGSVGKTERDAAED